MGRLDDLMDRFMKLPNAEADRWCGVSSRHDSEYAVRTDRIRSSLSPTVQDSDYFDFLLRYGGAVCEDPDLGVAVNIFGIGDTSYDLLDSPGNLIEDGMAVVVTCDLAIDPSEYGSHEAILGYAFATDRDPSGEIFSTWAFSSDLGARLEWRHRFPNFIILLDEIVDLAAFKRRELHMIASR